MNILILYGGKSCEHDISIITACLAKGYFDGTIYSAYFGHDNVCHLVPDALTPKQHKNGRFCHEIAFLTGKRQIAVMRRGKVKRIIDIDVAVNCCHGGCGENGAISGLCELADIPLVGSNVIASGVTLDKIVTKRLLAALKIPHIKGISLQGGLDEDNIARVEKLEYPVIVKPSTLGSSIGITLCKNQTELREGLEVAFCYDNRVLCEHALTNFFELNCAAMSVDGSVITSAVQRPYTSNDILTFQDKYLRGEKENAKIEDLPQKSVAKVRELTMKIYKEFGLSGVVRVDFLVDGVTNEVFVNEINSVPGSLAYGLWQDNYSAKQFGKLLIENAVGAWEVRNRLNYNYNSQILDGDARMKK